MNKIAKAVLIIAVSLSLMACGKTTQETLPDNNTETEAPFSQEENDETKEQAPLLQEETGEKEVDTSLPQEETKEAEINAVDEKEEPEKNESADLPTVEASKTPEETPNAVTHIQEQKEEEPQPNAPANNATEKAGSAKESCPYPLNVWTQTTSEQGCPIFVIYSQYNNIGDIRWKGNPTPDIFGNDTGQYDESQILWNTINEYGNQINRGFHFLYPVTKVGTYAEGTIYQCIAGAHYVPYNSGEAYCTNNPNCKVGAID